MLVGMLLTIVPAVLALFFGHAVMLAALALAVVLDVVLYRNLPTKGAAQFESF